LSIHKHSGEESKRESAVEDFGNVRPGVRDLTPGGIHGTILVTGSTGFVGGRLVRALSNRGIRPRCIVRSASKFKALFAGQVEAEVLEADLLAPLTLAKAVEGIETAFYLVHSMGGRTLLENRKFAERDRSAALNFARAAADAGIKRIIYLGGLGEMGSDLSEHLASRQEVAQILRSGSVSTTILRAANIIGSGGAPFEMLRHMVERLPVIVAPRWIDTHCQPIDIQDVIEYLMGCMDHPETERAEFDIGGPDIITYRKMMEIYARVRGLKRTILSWPFLSSRFSAFLISSFTPVPSGVTNPLLEGLKNEVICRENRIRDIIPIQLTPLEMSICNALQEVEAGPGKLLSRQSCFLRGE